MQSESSAARAAGVAGDYYYLGRVETLPEIRQKLTLSAGLHCWLFE